MAFGRFNQQILHFEDENPAGIVPVPGGPMPTVLDPDDAGSPAGFGPMSGRWAGRRRLLRQLDPALVDAATPEIPDAFAWSYFHASPPDQRCPFFVGDESPFLEWAWLASLEESGCVSRSGPAMFRCPP